MDITFSAKPQTPIPSVALSSSCSSQFFFPGSIRREFLGSAVHPRPLGLRSRTRSRSSGSGCRSPRCRLFDGSLCENSTLAVAAAVATLAAVQVIYLNYIRRRREADDEAFATQFLCSESFNSEDFKHERIGVVEGAHIYACLKRVYATDCKDDQFFKFNTVVLGCEEKRPGDSESDDKRRALMATDSMTAKTTGSERFNSSSIIIHEVDALEQGKFVANMPELLHEQQEEPGPTVSYIQHSVPILNSFAIPLKKERQVSQENHLEQIDTEVDEIMGSDYNKTRRKFAKEVSLCNEAEQPEVTPITFKSLSAEPLHVTLQDNNIYFSQLWSHPKGADVFRKMSPLTAVDLKTREASACLKEDPMGKEKELVKVHGSKGAMHRSFKHENDNIDLLGFPQPNGNLVKTEDDSLAYLKSYNRLLKDARLKDCIDLLEGMDNKGLLNMDKVHHASFLNACKKQKAVKEAFRFVKLIRNPTMSTFNMLLSVCASSQHFDGASEVMLLLKEAGLKPDCRLYTTLISTCAKSRKVDAMFEVFHEMVNAGVEPNVNTYGALIDGCGRAGQVAKAFGAYGIMRSKKVQPDRAIFNSLITACGESGAVDRAFDVLAEMRMEPKPIDPDHVTIGALIKTCTQAGQFDTAREVYKMLHQYNIKGTTEVYTIAVKSCCQAGDLDFAVSIYNDMKRNGVQPDEMFLSTLIDVAGHAGKVDAAFEILREARAKGIQLGHISYSSLMGACCNARNWQKGLELYEEIKAIQMLPTVSMLNALITSLCDGNQIMKSVEVLEDMKKLGVQPNVITYSLLIVGCERNGEAELGISLLTQGKRDGIPPNLIMCRCLTGLCLRSFEEACSLGEPVVSFNSGKAQIDNKWTSLAIMIYRETISAGVIPTIEVFSQVLGCLQFPRHSSLRNKFVENLGISFDASKFSNTSSLLDGFGEYDTRSFSVLEEAASLGVVPHVSLKESPIVVDARKLLIHIVEVYVLTILKGLKHRLAAGARLPNITILLPVEETEIKFVKGERTVSVSGRVGQAVGSLLRRLGLPYQGDESYGKIRINGLTLRRWFKPKLISSSSAGRIEMVPTVTRLAKGIADQQRNIRSSNNLSLEE